MDNRPTYYYRTVPRDFFNEAKLLKCMGRLALHVVNHTVPEGLNIFIEETGHFFNIELLLDGSLTVSNYPVYVNGIRVIMKSTYNSKREYPLICELDNEESGVFEESGEFTEEFVRRFTL